MFRSLVFLKDGGDTAAQAVHQPGSRSCHAPRAQEIRQGARACYRYSAGKANVSHRRVLLPVSQELLLLLLFVMM